MQVSHNETSIGVKHPNQHKLELSVYDLVAADISCFLYADRVPLAAAHNWSGDIDSKPGIRRGFRPSDGPGNPNRNFNFERVGNHGQLSGWHSLNRHFGELVQFILFIRRPGQARPMSSNLDLKL
jgi:hypothetical protein